MNHLEKFIVDNKEKLDLYSPNPKVWEELEKTLPKKKSKLRTLVLSLSTAAAVALCLGAYFFFLPSTEQDALAMVDKDLVHIDESYAMQIALAQEHVRQRQDEIKTMISIHPSLAEKFRADLTALDLTYDKLKGNLTQNDNQEVLLKAMISNLQLQIDVLEDQLALLEKLKNNSDESSIYHN
ncbi:MAG: hypothetical protein KTR24_00945 [Saprospiraceae bacterium]|nr:hypothetical protein [Saprospiraceae bacterium]